MKNWIIVLISAVMLSICCMSLGDNVYGGIWLSGSDNHKLVIGESWSSFVAKWQSYSSQNLRLVDLEIYNDANDGSLKFNGVYRSGSYGHYLYTGFTWAQFTAKWSDLAKNGYRLVNIETYVEGGVRKYAGVWHAGTDGYYLWNSDWNSFTAKWNELSSKNMRLVDVEPYLDNGVVKYIGVWRSGSGGHYLWNSDWSSFTAKYNSLNNLKLTVYKTYLDGAGKRRFVGVWRNANSAGSYLWSGVDKENFLAKHNELSALNLRLVGIVTFASSCSSSCTNLVNCNCNYNYKVTGTSNYYRNPVDTFGSIKHPRLSALAGKAQIFKLPFSDGSVKRVNGWLYGADSFHHAVDYAIDGKQAFQVKAAAAGVVEYVGYDNWSGNTVIIRHNSVEGTDTYRTVYMHLRNGPYHDCSLAWTNSIPILSGDSYTKYSDHLKDTGCAQNPNNRNPKADHWGTNSQTIKVLVGQTVSQGQLIGYSGQTGPGGKNLKTSVSATNNHLHIFFTRKDPTNGEFYFVDPYGIYGLPQCYPSSTTGAYSGTAKVCARYPILFKDGYPQYS